VITLDIPMATPSLNETRYKHWTAYARQKKLWRRQIWAARVATAQRFAVTPQRAKVTIERHGKLLDVDNFLGGLKPIIDALKGESLIQDDSPKHLQLVTTQFEGAPRTVITVEAA
jgi:hypothetical protein